MAHNKRMWPPGADRTITLKVTDEQWIRWTDAARINSSVPHLGAWITRAADFYASRLQARLDLALRLEKEGKL